MTGATFGTSSDADSVSTGTPNVDRTATDSAVQPPLPSPPSPATGKKRRPSKYKPPRQLSRSASTPQLREAAMSDLELDKKRNKLGYQRISIACAHCRRRKIRCLLAEGDPQRRCQNCIRLKKDCHFYPVEQQAAMENGTELGGPIIPGSDPPSVVSVSPQHGGMDRGFDSAADFRFSTLPSNAPLTFQGMPFETGSALSGHGSLIDAPERAGRADALPGGFSQPEYSYRMAHDPRSWPTSRPSDASSIHAGPETQLHVSQASPFAQAGMTGDFAPYPTNNTANSGSIHPAQGFSYPHSRSEAAWQHSQPLRSSSYNQLDTMQSPHAAYPNSFQQMQDPHNAAMRYPPTSLALSTLPMAAHTNGPHSAPVGGPIRSLGQPQAFSFPQPTGHPDGAPLFQSQSYPTGWYTDHTAFGPLAEEPENYGSGQQRPG
ncbi:hypothetical protein BAUCODRAFT_149659 [Baudoinia panamericana UAMH 10762]|uniref:Zn(2)-C6 fungal-type domain-containing protein n=1 Tax=Baudoinia panamericana (strain UAMH 10762) TaxID=717646 RepID=M2N6X4_BAUPA|nr:uncharacterized protein BAUCODRAFT_149659 [Baudoinia panamericana UAMH 10762]EMC94520.1 hypothetical protein BAUCODRAFT_149659 [Baudoinia panamericana UAMH 10762]